MFEPFKNDHQSTQIGNLVFENQTDKVIIYGDIDIAASATGLTDALKIQQIINEVVNHLQSSHQHNLNLHLNDQDEMYPDGSGKPRAHDVADDHADSHASQDKPLQTSKKVGNPFS